MSTEIKANLKDKTIVEFWGGIKRGAMLQITGDGGHVQFELKEAVETIKLFSDFVSREARRRQDILKTKVEGVKALENTVFNEIAFLDKELIEIEVKLLGIELIDKLTPISGTTTLPPKE